MLLPSKLRQFFNKTICLVLLASFILPLGGCGLSVNSVKLARSLTSTYVTGSVFSETVNPAKTTIFLRLSDSAGFGTSACNNLKLKVAQQLQQNGFKVVENISDANVIMAVFLKNYGILEDSTVNNLRKYANYSSTAGAIKLGHDGSIKGSDFSFHAGDGDSELFTPGGLRSIPRMSTTRSTVSSLLGMDAISGAGIGVVVMYALFLTVPAITGIGLPAALIIGGLTGALLSSIADVLTRPVNYGGFVDVHISIQGKQVIEMKEKLLSSISSNLSQEAYFEGQTNWMEHRAGFSIITSSVLREKTARKAFIEEASYTLGNMF